jgi:aspartyl-tRNA(Asn)/glutamyl-tRNA(Gln) amidotransferase subunit C
MGDALPSSDAGTLTRGQVDKLARLARLELGEAELEHFTRQLGQIVGYVAQLQQVPTDGVEPLAHALDLANVFRPDEPGASLPVPDALANAPRRQHDYFSVPAVLD